MIKFLPLVLFVTLLCGVAMLLAKRCDELERKCDALARRASFSYHDGLCMLVCFDGRCKCHDHCGPLCNTWRQLVLDGIIEPTGYEYKLTQEAIINCLLANRKAVR